MAYATDGHNEWDQAWVSADIYGNISPEFDGFIPSEQTPDDPMSDMYDPMPGMSDPSYNYNDNIDNFEFDLPHNFESGFLDTLIAHDENVDDILTWSIDDPSGYFEVNADNGDLTYLGGAPLTTQKFEFYAHINDNTGTQNATDIAFVTINRIPNRAPEFEGEEKYVEIIGDEITILGDAVDSDDDDSNEPYFPPPMSGAPIPQPGQSYFNGTMDIFVFPFPDDLTDNVPVYIGSAPAHDEDGDPLTYASENPSFQFTTTQNGSAYDLYYHGGDLLPEDGKFLINVNDSAGGEDVAVVLFGDPPSIAEAKGYGWESQDLILYVLPDDSSDLENTKYEFDFNNDGEYDLTLHEDEETGYVFETQLDFLGLLHESGDPDQVEDGEYVAKLKVTSEIGSTAEFDVPITIEELQPAVSIDAEQVDRLTYSIDISTHQMGPDTVTGIEIDWGDGTVDTYSGDQTSASHEYERHGTYAIEIEAIDSDRNGYLGYIASIPEPPKPYLIEAYANIDPITKAATVTVSADSPNGPIESIEWDFNSDSDYADDQGETVQLFPRYYGEGDNEYEYWAVAKITDVDGLVGYSLVSFIENGPVTPSAIRSVPHVAQKPGGFNINAALEIVQTLRPDVYQWWTTSGAVLEQEFTQGWVTGWFYWNTWDYQVEKAGKEIPYLRLAAEMSEIEAAQAIIYRAEHGYYSYKFHAWRITALSGADDFATVEAFAKWQQWWASQAAQNGVTGYEVLANWYTFQLGGGAEFIMTATDAVENGLHWTHALELIPVLPWLAKLEIPIKIRTSSGDEVATVIKRADGTLEVIRAGARYELDEIFPSGRSWAGNGDTIISQANDTRCGPTCLEMLLSDWDVPMKDWTSLIKNADFPNGTSAEQVVALLEDSVSNGHVLKNPKIRHIDSPHGAISFGSLKESATSHPAIVMLDAPGQLSEKHWIIFDRLVEENGKVFASIRDPGSGKFVLVPEIDFALMYARSGLAIIF